MLTYRKASSADSAQLAALSIEVWLHTYAKTGISNTYADYVLERFTPDYYQNKIEDTDKQIIVCEMNAHLLGFIALDFTPAPPDCLLTFSNIAEITTLYIRVAHAGCGIGQALMQQAREAASSRNSGSIFLSVLHNNYRALHFYQMQGLRPQGSIWFELNGEKHKNYVLTQDLTHDF